MEIRDGIVLKPVRKVNVDELRRALRRHWLTLRELPDRREPRPGELAEVSLEEEFD